MVTITDKEFRQLSDYIKRNYGINLKEEKKVLVTGRLQHILQELGCNSFTEYFEYVISEKSGKAITRMIDKITTNHTFFMRESDHFKYFQDTILPQLKEKVVDKDMRIWCAACSSGEEAYTLAMILDDYLGLDKQRWDSKILATDISEHVLAIAKSGIYSADKIEPLPLHWKYSYFNKLSSDSLVISDKIKHEVIFRKFNLMEEVFPFKKKFHVIFCRNVMIYFDHVTKSKLINKMYDQLEYGGYLFLGHSESINRATSKFQYVMPSVYKKS